MLVRLQKILAGAGVGSRRKCEEIIKDGRVSVDGITVTVMGSSADPYASVICLDGIPIKPERKVYAALNKPVGYISSAKDQFGRPTVSDLTISIGLRVFPVGRLDYDSSGLIFMTNDGGFAYKLTHPKHNINKTYLLEIDDALSESALNTLREGVLLDDGITAPAEVDIAQKSGDGLRLLITITEGRNRQVRRMIEAVGRRVLSLHRVSIGGVELGQLESGKYRFLNEDEINRLIGE